MGLRIVYHVGNVTGRARVGAQAGVGCNIPIEPSEGELVLSLLWLEALSPPPVRIPGM